MEENKDTIKEKEGIQVYELGFHMLSSLNEEELESAISSLRDAITAHGGSLISEGTTELIDLAYTMSVNEGGKHSRYDTAYFGWIKFEMDPKKADEINKEVFVIDKNILRYILIKTVREETRAQMKEDSLKVLEEVKTTGTIENKQFVDEGKQGEEVSEIELDKAVEELTKE